MKDFYDIYILMALHKDLFNIKILNSAIKKTFLYRKTTLDKNSFMEVLNALNEDKDFHLRWRNFTKKNYYVNGVNFEAVKDKIMQVINLID